jgi:uncharacterized membrane protein
MDQRLPICKHRAAPAARPAPLPGGTRVGDRDEARAGAVPLALLLLASPAWGAEPALPGLFEVSGVAPGDVLNVRAAPDAAAEIIGGLVAGATGIEVVGLDPSGRWGRVNTGERGGWAAMRYLAPGPDVWREGGLPASLRCFGTEPFWSLAPEGGAAVFATPEAPERRLALAAVLDASVPADPRRALIAEGEGMRLVATIAPGACSDGMSDRAFGLTAAVVVEAEAPALLTGCCSVAP